MFSFIHLWNVTYHLIIAKELFVDAHSFNTSAEFILHCIICQITECNVLTRFAQ
jgi:hypothetical protein